MPAQKAAAQGLPVAFCLLGNLYRLGHGVPQNLEQAAAWCRKGAEMGDAESQNTPGYLYARGMGARSRRGIW